MFAEGEAYLALITNNMLETEVNNDGKPNREKNSTIHALSGGEKALTALLLVLLFFV